ncbi:zinc-binding alcohol dehydrogenase family protein [Salinimonas lutimaris]|uniref:zinc-binding alcohol dehydrogenase family protein n=1 Tax=Salinimonas lutimaris TaxID=914153 RepID=UPI0010C0455D|nr:zinc-binding alcohol dehydrogenase family protein [Salinimonas lutimaris]
MKAIGYYDRLPISDKQALVEAQLPQPEATGRDVLVKVNAISVNPVDFKIRQNVAPADETLKVLGWDAVGEVIACGDAVSTFAPGDTVFYAGDLNRQGSNAQYQLVDERLIAHKPASLSDAEAAALPLTSLTAWELLFEHLEVGKDEDSSPATLLITGASGGVGSIMIQLAKLLTNATVIATASRPQTQAWVKTLGADYVVDHIQDLVSQIRQAGFEYVTHVASLTHTQDYLDDYVELLKPMGKLGLTDDPDYLDAMKLKSKSLSLHWEFMFTRSMFTTDDMQQQHHILQQVAQLIDEKKLRTTVGQNLGKISAENLREAHRILESGQSVGKLVLEGF